MSLDLTLKNLEFNFKGAETLEKRVFEFENFRLDAATKLLYRGGEQLTLTPKTVETLLVFVERPGEIISKDDLIETIWGTTIVEESNLAQYVHILRKTLGSTTDGQPFIETLKRRGYRFNGTVRLVNNNVIELPLKGANVDRAAFREPLALAPTPSVKPASFKFAPLAAIFLVVLLGVAVFAAYKMLSGGNTPINDVSVPFNGSEITRLTTAGRSKRAAISPDGLYVAQIMTGADGESVWVRQVAVANDTRITAPSQSEFVWVTFAPDSSFVYYLALERDKGEPELFRVPVLGGPVVKIANDIGAPAFSPDGTKMAYMKTDQEKSNLVIANADGSTEMVLTSRSAPDYMNIFWNAPAWSLDGRSIAFPVNQADEKGRYETVMAIDVETRAERRLSDTRWQQVGQARWLRDGLVVAAAGSSTAPKQLWHISLADGAATRITRDLNDYQDISITSDEKTLAVVQRHVVSNIWTAGKDAVAAKQVMSEVGWLNEIIWLPDGRLAYTSNAGGTSDIWTMDADGTNIRQLTVGANARLGLAVTADEKQLIFAAEQDGKYNLWRVNIDGSGLARITNGDGEFYPQVTPDGRWIVYQSGGSYPTLWKMPVEGGEAVQITRTSASRPSISPDGKQIAYHYLDSSIERSRWSIGISSLEDGNRTTRFDFPSTVVERLVKWTRDGKSIAFLNSPGGIPNIWLHPLDGGAAKPLTNFPSDNIIAFNWNTDGSQLAVIRGVETSDVLLFGQASK